MGISLPVNKSATGWQTKASFKHMGERFVVVPVAGGAAEGDHPAAAAAAAAIDPASATGWSQPGDESVSGHVEPNSVVPILEYNREPNKYGESPACPLRVRFIICVLCRINVSCRVSPRQSVSVLFLLLLLFILPSATSSHR